MNLTLKKAMLLVAGALMSLGSSAVPARKGIVTYSQPDGSSIDIIVCGDEHCGYFMTPDSILLHEDADGFLRPATENYRDRIKAVKAAARDIARTSLNDGEVPTTGTLRGLVILAEFPDMPFAPNNTPEQFQRLLNEEGYSDGGATGSVRDYYKDQSYGLFTPEFDVAGPVMLPNEMAYYGGDRNGMTDVNVYRMIQDACRLADETVDFSRYDNNNDGKVDLVYVIYSGYAQSNGASTNTVWPHMWFLSRNNAAINLDGVVIDRYACSSERLGINGTAITGIGLFCHEFSHTLGLPDIYDTTNSGSKLTMGEWDVMDLGCYNNSMRTPAGYSSYEKSVLGWIEPELPESKATGVTLPSLGSEARAIKMVSTSDPDEYFLLETRSKSDKWDAHLPGEGMLIVKVKYDAEVWDANAVNTGENHGVYLIPANGNFSPVTDGPSSPFPGTGNVTAWTDLTTPSSLFSDGTYLGCAVTGISYDGSTTTFNLGESLDTPELTAPTEISETGFRANWNRVADAKFYTVEITAISTGKTTRYEKIVRNRFTFTGLDPQETYCYRVRAIGEILVSDLSRPAEITLASQSGIATVNGDNDTSVKAVYTLTGQYCGTATDNLSPGLYIVTFSDGSATKIMKQ